MRKDTTERFMRLFEGLPEAYGTGDGGWVREPVTADVYAEHLRGEGPGLGVAPLRRDATVKFAAIDLDEPNFELAEELKLYLPNATGDIFIERSRSGNAHLWVFFAEPCKAWVARAILRYATTTAEKPRIEVFPKQDQIRAEMVGNYINLPYYGSTRPIVENGQDLSLEEFLERAEQSLHSPSDWMKRINWLRIPSPTERAAQGAVFGTQSTLHICADYVLQNRETNPIVQGHRAVVYFSLAKMFANCNQYSDDESLMLLSLINEASPDPVPQRELASMYQNAVRGQFTSTGCDDPLFAPYASPKCSIANKKN